jgi:hypothetical protein
MNSTIKQWYINVLYITVLNATTCLGLNRPSVFRNSDMCTWTWTTLCYIVPTANRYSDKKDTSSEWKVTYIHAHLLYNHPTQPYYLATRPSVSLFRRTKSDTHGEKVPYLATRPFHQGPPTRHTTSQHGSTHGVHQHFAHGMHQQFAQHHTQPGRRHPFLHDHID